MCGVVLNSTARGGVRPTSSLTTTVIRTTIVNKPEALGGDITSGLPVTSRGSRTRGHVFINVVHVIAE